MQISAKPDTMMPFLLTMKVNVLHGCITNPDSIEGGQFVNNEVSFLQILEAAEKESNVEEVFLLLGKHRLPDS